MKRILTIAGSDSSGGAGIQADLKTITALGGYGMSAVTALTAQNTTGVFEVVGSTPSFVALQIDKVLSDIGADAIKTGMLFNKDIIECVAEMLKHHSKTPTIVDPVMVSTSGSILLKEDAIDHLIKYILPNATLVTPNLPEAELISGITIDNAEDRAKAAQQILTMGAKAVLIKGGHANDQTISDILFLPDGSSEIFTHPRIDSPHTHGTGCTLSAAIATFLAQGYSLSESVSKSTHYVTSAIQHAPQLGKGNGPLNHYIALSN